LVGLIHALWVVAKGAPTTAATVAIHRYTTIAAISHRLPHFPPSLEGLPLAVRTLFGAIFGFALDIWQLQDDNRHGRLRVDVWVVPPSYTELAVLCQNPPLMLQTLRIYPKLLNTSDVNWAAPAAQFTSDGNIKNVIILK
jgi:hypothetical protein